MLDHHILMPVLGDLMETSLLIAVELMQDTANVAEDVIQWTTSTL